MNQIVNIISLLSLITPLINNVAIRQSDIIPEQNLKANPRQIYIYQKYQMTIISIADTFDFIFIPRNAESIDSVARKGNYKIMINGSFFGGIRLAAEHAGWLRLFGKTYSLINSVSS